MTSFSTVVPNFNPRPPQGGRLKEMSSNKGILRISIHALRREGDRSTDIEQCIAARISIHALRREGDQVLFCFLHIMR